MAPEAVSELQWGLWGLCVTDASFHVCAEKTESGWGVSQAGLVWTTGLHHGNLEPEGA